MTPDDIKTFFEGLIDDSPDEDVTYNLMDTAYTKRNESRVWAMLMKLDQSITHSTSDVWTTQHTLPTDFGSAYKLFGGSSDNEYDLVPFEEMLRWKSSPNVATLDMVNLKMLFGGAPSSALTMYLYYQYVPTSLFGLSDADKANVATIVWPTRFRKLLAYDMAALWFGGADSDDISRLQSPVQRSEALELRRAMEAWDNRNRMKMRGNSSAQRRSAPTEKADVLNW